MVRESSVEAGERLYSHAQQKVIAEEALLSTLDIEVCDPGCNRM